MLFILIKKEFLVNLISFRFAVATILCLVLILLSLMVLKGDYEVRLHDYETNQQEYKEQLQRSGSIWELGRSGIQVDRSPEKLGISVVGLENSLSPTVKVDRRGVPTFEQSDIFNPVLHMFPVADMLFVVATVLGLMAFVMSYDAITGEREHGTLKLLMSYSVPRDLVILAKWIGGFLSLIAPFVLAVLVGAVIVFVSNSPAFAALDWKAYLLIILASILFLAVMFSIGLFISALCRESHTAISVLIFIWVIFVLIIPNVSPYAIEQFTDAETFQGATAEIVKQRDQLRDEYHDWRSDEYRRLRKKARRMSDEDEAALWAEYNAESTQRREEMDKMVDKYSRSKLNEFKRGQGYQIRLTKNISRLSPIASYVYTTTDIANTGLENYFLFLESVERYNVIFNQYLREEQKKIRGKTSFSSRGGRRGPSHEAFTTPADISAMPEFDEIKADLSQRLLTSIWDITSLLAVVVIFFLASFVSFLRADII